MCFAATCFSGSSPEPSSLVLRDVRDGHDRLQRQELVRAERFFLVGREGGRPERLLGFQVLFAFFENGRLGLGNLQSALALLRDLVEPLLDFFQVRDDQFEQDGFELGGRIDRLAAVVHVAEGLDDQHERVGVAEEGGEIAERALALGRRRDRHVHEGHFGGRELLRVVHVAQIFEPLVGDLDRAEVVRALGERVLALRRVGQRLEDRRFAAARRADEKQL